MFAQILCIWVFWNIILLTIFFFYGNIILIIYRHDSKSKNGKVAVIMYSVCLVDDEIWALRGLESSFPWEKYGFEIAFSTTRSTDALNFITTEKPDVVFTDVRMPKITGLELSQKASDARVTSLFIFVSGFSDFEYVQGALRNFAFDYVLKPIDDNEAEKVLARLKKRLDDMPRGIVSDNSKLENLTKNIKNATFKSIIEYMNSNYMNKISMTDVANKFYLNPSYCSSLFTKYLDMPFSQYLNHIRIREAVKLIDSNEDLSFSEIAELVGYKSLSHFSRVFLYTTGVSPSKYKERGGIS